MLYIDVIFKTLIDIFFLKDPLLLISFLLFLILFYLLWVNLRVNHSKTKFFILFIRFLILLFFFPLLNNKIFKNSNIEVTVQDIGVLIDNSLSVQENLKNNSIDIDSVFQVINYWGNQKNVNLHWYNLDSLINKDNIIFDRKNTSFDYMNEISSNNYVDQLIFISDGNVNSGIISNNFDNTSDLKIHTIGLGNLFNVNQDIGIDNFNINMINDSININTTFSAKINNPEQKVIFNISSNDNVFYLDTITLMEGMYNFDKNIKFNSQEGLGNNFYAEVIPLTFSDIKPTNNNWKVNINTNIENDILLITGKLTYNTSFLKSSILNLPNINLNHQIILNNKFDYSIISNKDFDCVILDNFPNNSKEFEIFKNLYDKNINLIFFEGYGYNYNFLKMMLDVISPNNFIMQNKAAKKSFKLENNIDLGYLDSNYDLFCNDCDLLYKIDYFSNKSIAQISKSNFHAILIPNISEAAFLMNSKYNSTYINEYLEYVINNKLQNNSLLDLNLNKSSYYIGEKILFKLKNNIPFDILDSKVIIKDLENSNIDSINYFHNMDLFFNKSGNFEIYFLFKGTNSEIINSNIESFYVADYNVELESQTQNSELLKEISDNSGGLYIDINYFNASFLDNINYDLESREIKNIYTALDIFIKEKFFLFIIMLFCVEVFLRKRLGLL